MKIHIFVRSQIAGEAEMEALRTGIGLAGSSPRTITIVVPAKRHANGKPLTYILSENQVDLLAKGKLVKISENVLGILESNQTLSTKPESQIVVAVRAWSNLIPKIKKVSGIEHLLVVAPTEEEAEQWQQEFTAKEHNNAFNAGADKAGSG